MNKYWKLALLAGAAAATGGAALAPAAAGGAGAAGAAGGGLLGGAGAGAAGGAGLLGGATTAAIPMGSAVGTPLASAAAGGGLAPTGWAGYMAQAKPFMDAAGTGIQTAQGLMPQDGGAPPPPQLPQQMGAQTLQALAQQAPQMDVMAEAEMRRKRRQGLLGGYQ